MLPQHLYDLAKKVELYRLGLEKLNKDLLNFHLLRFKYFVEASPISFNCTYAKLSHKYFEEQDEIPKIIERLESMKKLIDSSITELKRCQTKQMP